VIEREGGRRRPQTFQSNASTVGTPAANIAGWLCVVPSWHIQFVTGSDRNYNIGSSERDVY
jgi:hypothetical protein